MGTNIYVNTPPCPSACAHCSEARQVHLGKFSAGWPFLFRAPERGDGTFGRYDEWLKLAESGQIVDEYGTSYELDRVLANIESRSGDGRWDQSVIRDEQGRYWAEWEFV